MGPTPLPLFDTHCCCTEYEVEEGNLGCDGQLQDILTLEQDGDGYKCRANVIKYIAVGIRIS
jgi:hypothetical protein